MKKPIAAAMLAAVLYGISAPLSKLLLVELSPVFLAALLYMGAGIGMLFVNLFEKMKRKNSHEAKMTSREIPYILGMIILDIVAPIFLMLGLMMTTSSNTSLLNNFEIVATSLIALFIFKEAIGKRMWVAISLITLSSLLLSFENIESLEFSPGSLLVLLACLAWGLENNCTRMLSLKDPRQIVVIKGFGSGTGSLIIALLLKEYNVNWGYILMALVLGFFAYGLSIYFYIKAQRYLGAARTSSYYAAAPFIGVILSWIILREPISGSFALALVIMLIGTYFIITEDHSHKHFHFAEIHEHKHSHRDGHHEHNHDYQVIGSHSHEHEHDETDHEHLHFPDLHHRHPH